jgi:hypothetical protein
MPNIEKHCKRTLKRYGVEGREIHEWLDAPSRKYAGTHRQFRHDTETIRLVGEIFGKKYGKSLAENIALDHIMLDHEEEIKKHRTIIVKLPEKEEIPSVPCSYCDTLLRPSDQFCPNCGASRTKIIEKFDRMYEMEKIRLQEKRKKLRKELKREIHLRDELSPEQRMHLWMLYPKTAWDYHILKKLVREDFEKYPELKKKFEIEMMKRKKARKEAKFSVAILLFGIWLLLVGPIIFFTIVYRWNFGGFEVIWFLFWTVILGVLAVASLK